MYKRILIPLDGSPLAEQALPHAIAHARCFRAELVLLKVQEPIPEVVGVSPGALRHAKDRTRELARDYLDRLATPIRAQGVRVETVTVDGRPHVEIPRFAEVNQVDLIVLSARGRSGLSRWLMGSVADRVVRGAAVPVMLVQSASAQAPE